MHRNKYTTAIKKDMKLCHLQQHGWTWRVLYLVKCQMWNIKNIKQTSEYNNNKKKKKTDSQLQTTVGLKLNIQKTKIMASGPITSWQIDGETVETVVDFIFGGIQNHCRWGFQP